MAHKREAAPSPPRTHLDALSCSHARDFWPPNRVLARNPPHLKGKGCSRTTKAQIGRTAQAKARQRSVGAYQNAVWRPEIDVFPARETAGRARRPPPSESSARPQTPRRRSAVPFGICRLPPAKGAPFAAASPLRLSLRVEAPRSGKREGVRDRRPFDGCALRRAQPLSRSSYGSSCSADAVSPPTMRVYGTAPARHQAAPFGRQTRLRSTPFSRHSSRVSRPRSTHRDPVRICRSTRPKRVRAAGLALAVKATPDAAPSARRPARTRLAVPRPPAAPSKAPSVSAVPPPQRRK